MPRAHAVSLPTDVRVLHIADGSMPAFAAVAGAGPTSLDAVYTSFQIVSPDGSLFLEGQGVQPTVRVPIDEQSVLSSDDVVLKAAEAELTK